MTTDRVAAFAADLHASAAALERLLDRWRPVELGHRSSIVIAGLGSSRFAGMVAADQARAQGRPVWVEVATAGEGTAAGSDLVCIVVSASGRTPEVLATAERHRGQSLVIAVTNRDASPLTELADVVVPLLAGDEAAGIASRSYRATLAAITLLIGASRVETLRPVVDVLGARSEDAAATTAIDAALEALDGAAAIDVVAPAPLLGAAEQAALMLRELARLPAHAVDTGEWLHTAVYLAWPGHRVLRVPGSPADGEVAATVGRRGGVLVDLPPVGDASTDPISRAIVTSLDVERLALGLWHRASAEERPAE